MPNGDVIDSLQIQLTADVSKATRSIGTLIKRFEKLESVCVGMNTGAMSQNFSRVNSSLNSLSSSTKKFGNALDGVKKKLSVLSMKSFSASVTKLNTSLPALGRSAKSAGEGIGSFTTSFTSAIIRARAFIAVVKRLWNAFSDGIKLASDLTEVQNVVDKAFGNEASKLEELVQTSIQQLGMSELTAKQIASRYQSMGKAMGISSGAVKKASEQIGQLREGYNSAAESMADVSLNLTRLSADMASFYNVDIDSVAEDLNAVFTGQTRPLRQYGLDLTQATLQEWALKNGIDADVKSMTQAEKTLLRYQYVMAQTKLVQGDFADTADTWANRVKVLKQQFEALGAVIGGGLINALKPFVAAMNTALTGIISFAKTVVNALGKIFGWEYEITSGGSVMDDSLIDALEEQSGGLDDVADSAGGAADKLKEAKTAAEEYKNTVLGFDELNKLNDTTGGAASSPSSPSGSGGTGSAGKPSALPTGGAISAGDIQVSFKRTKALYESEIDTLYDLGKYIGKTLTRAMNDIDWDSIYEKARGFGTGLAQFLNGLISPQLFSALGKTIANSLNTVIYGINAFNYTFDFKNLGKSVATGINSLFVHFDFEALAEGLAVWKNNLWDAIDSTISNINWGLIASSITTGINTYLATVDWGKRTLTLSLFAIKLLAALGKVFAKIKWELLLNNIKDAFLKVDFKGVGTEIISTLWAGLTGDEMDKGTKEKVYQSLSTLEEKLDALTQFTFDALYDFYDLFLRPVGEWVLGTAIPDLANAISDFSDLVDWDTLTSNLKKFWGALARFTLKIGTGLTDFIDGVSKPMLGLIIRGFSTAIEALATALDGVPDEVLESIGSGIGLVVTAALAITHPVLASILGLSLVLGALGRESAYQSFIDNADDIALGIKTVTGELDTMNEKADADYNNVKDTLDKFYELNTKLKNGGYLNPQEAEQYETYKQALSSYSGAIKTEFEKIDGYYDGTKQHLEDLIAVQYNQILLSGYQTAISKYGAAAAEASTQLELSREALVSFLAEKAAFIAPGLNLNTSDFNAIAEYYATGHGKLSDAQRQYMGMLQGNGYNDSTFMGFNPDIVTGIRDDFALLTDAVTTNAESYQKANHEIDICQKKILGLETKISGITGATEKESDAIDTAVRGTAKDVAHVINESGEVVVKETERPWKAAYKAVRKQADAIDTSVKGLGKDVAHAIYESGDEAVKGVSSGLSDVDETIVNKTPQVESDAILFGTAAGGGLGRGFYMVLQQNIAPNIDLTEQLVSGVKSKITNGFEIQGGTSRYAEKAGQSIPAGLKTGTEEGTPSLLNKFIALPGRIKQSMGDLFGFMKPSGVSMISGIGSGAESQSPWAITKIVGIRNSLIGAFGGLSGSMWGVGRDAISHLIGGITSMHVPIPHIQSAGSVLQAIGGVGMAMPQYQVAWYANGGLATSSSIVGVGEAGHEGILPLTNASAMQEIAGAIVSGMIDSGAIADAVTRGMVAAGQNNDRPVIVNATLRTENDEVLARAVTRGQRKINYRTSPVAP